MASVGFKSVVDTVFDSVEGYRKAVEKADSAELKRALETRRQAREKTLAALNSELERQGDELVSKGTLTGAVHRLWVDISDLFENGDEAAAERVEEGEGYLAGKFREVLEEGDLGSSERAALESCLAEVEEGRRFGQMIEKRYD